MKWADEVGAGRWIDKGEPGDRARWAAHPAVWLTLAVTLAGCQVSPGTGSTDIDTPGQARSVYPDLAAIPSPSSSGRPLEERRQIVRDLIENRDLARHKKAVIRHRSGLSATPPPAAPELSGARAEEIIRGAPVEDTQALDEAAEDDSPSGPNYRQRTQFDDGTLDDFIRRLKRDTAPSGLEPPPADGVGKDGDTSVLPEDAAPQAWRFTRQPTVVHVDIREWEIASYQPAVLQAFAAPVLREDRYFAVRLAAAEEDPGFFCSYLGWMVAWSNACIEESDAGSDDSDLTANADENESAEDGAPSESDTSAAKKDAGENGAAAESDGSIEGGAQTSETLDEEPIIPVASALDRLRDLLRSRRSGRETSSDRKSLSYEAEELKPSEETGPPLPRSRPEVEEDFQIVRNDVLFEFNRTPRPAFKPTQPEPETVIYPPKVPRRAKKSIFIPKARPEPVDVAHQDVVQKPDDDVQIQPAEPQPDAGESAAQSLDDAKAEVAKPAIDTATPAAATPLESEDGSLLDSEVILFDPASAQLPPGIEPRLADMLKEANAEEAKLFIVSEAGVGRLAMERARSVGLALVRLGATADVIEYDIIVTRDADLVRVLLKPDETVASGETATSDLEKVK